MSGSRLARALLCGLALVLSAHANEEARHLYSQFACAACHDASGVALLPPARGPGLDGVAERLKIDWIRRFLTDPQKVKPGTTMPNLLGRLPEEERAETAKNLTVFLTGRPEVPPTPRFSDPVNGERLYKTIGCAVCHGETAPDLSAKYTFGGLIEFLVNPLATHPDGPMPSLGLSNEEAGDIAHYLLPETEEEHVRILNLDHVEAGKHAFEALNCAACHTRKSTLPPTTAKISLIEILNDGSTPDCAGPPQYHFSKQQRAVMMEHREFPAFTPESALTAHLRRLNCYACHERDQIGGPNDAVRDLFTGDDTLGNDGRYPPHLNGVGAKLTKRWLTKVLHGKGAVRPYLNVRMPVFGSNNTDLLVDLFAKIDLTPVKQPEIDGDVEAGHQLMGVNGGMGCITCHGWGTNEGVAMRAVNLANTTERLRFDWFKEHLINPQRMRPGTLMPSFWPDGKSGNPNVLAGDTNQQIAALWSFLERGKRIPEGFPDPGSGRFEIIPKDRPVIQRGFIDPAGTSAIAVGFPDRIHFVYDAKLGAPIGAWKGRFLDGYKLWFSRLDPTARPLGDDWLSFDVVTLPGNPRFKGYRINPKSGVPTFLLQAGKIRIEDTLEPLPESEGFKRTLRIMNPEPKIRHYTYKW